MTFDARPLIDPVDRLAVRDHARTLHQAGAFRSLLTTGSGVFAVVFGGVMVLVFGSFFVSMLVSIVGALAATSEGNALVLALGAILPTLVLGGIVAAVIGVAVRAQRRTEERRYRLDGFARSNGMDYLPAMPGPALPGMIFGQGSSQSATDLVRGERPRFVEFGNYQYTTGSGKNRTTHRWGYVAIKLDVPLPHIVLDATGNNGMFGGSNLAATFDRDQRLSLEGDFDTYFSLYCPEGYERDALYLFTPDVMARFIDNAAALDVEIVDDWLFLYAKTDLSTLDPAVWAWLFSCVGALLAKLDQWARWRDDRLAAGPPVGAPAVAAENAHQDAAASAPAGFLRPPPGVAEPGRRLTRTIPWWSYVVAGLFIAFWLFMQVVGR
ncbi:MAG TPA: hypothetical protein VFY91_16560 [Microbacterium sp.]|nr:hypothetical protein [Microbacterium sp.]